MVPLCTGTFDQILLGIINTLLNCFGHFACFSESVSHCTLTIAYYYKSREAEGPATFGHLGHTLNTDDLFGRSVSLGLTLCISFIRCHTISLEC